MLHMLKRNIPGTIKITFVSTFIFGVLVHGYMLANFLINHDGLAYFAYFADTFETNIPDTLTSGRWFQDVAIAISGFAPMPWVIGLVSVFYLSVTACIIVACLEIKRAYCAALVGLILVTFPAAGVVFAYIQVADSILLSVLLACLSAYLSKKFRFGFLLGAIVLALSLGIVQTYITFTAGLFLIMLILDTLHKRESDKAILLRAVKYVSCLALGLILYVVVLQYMLATRDVVLTAYQGIDQMGRLPLRRYVRLTETAYREFFYFFLQHPYWFLTSRLQILNRITFILPLILSPAMLVWLAAKNWLSGEGDQEEGFRVKNRDWKRWLKRSMPRILLLGLFVILFPPAVNAIYIMGAHSVYLMLLYASSLVFVLVIALLDRLDVSLRDLKSSVKKYVGVFLCWVSLALLLFAPYNYFVLLNENYLRTDLTLRQTYHISSTLAERVRAFPGYVDGMTVVLAGHHSAGSDLIMYQLSRYNDMPGFPTTEQLINERSYHQFFPIFLGESLSLYLLQDDYVNRERFYEVISELEIFPAEGSMRIVEGALFIRMSEEF